MGWFSRWKQRRNVKAEKRIGIDRDTLSAGQGESNSRKLPDGRTATVSVRSDGKSASLDIE